MKLRPCYREYLWGGTRLKSEFGKTDAPEVTAESWELAGHLDGCSSVAEGLLKGKTLADLAKLDRDGFWGRDCRMEEFPLLVKLIDAQKDLSIQVHPSSQTALAELGEQGKVELWYVVDCEPQSFIYYGFSQKISKEEFLKHAREGSICQVLNQVPVEKGDVFCILPGTIHAIGAGIIIAEIQQNSNTTFRVYDYQRRGTNGVLRPLHLERAAAVLNYEPVVSGKCKANSGAFFPAFNMAEMFSCRYFRAYRFDIRQSVLLRCDGNSFQHILCVEGNGIIQSEAGEYPFARGDSFFMPADLGGYEIAGRCRVLLSRI